MSKLAGRPRGKPWSKEDREYITANYGKTSIDDLAAYFGRTREAIKQFASVHKLAQIEHWSKAEDDFLRDNFQGMTYQQLADKLGRTHGAVRARAQTIELAGVVDRLPMAGQKRQRERQYGVGPAHAKIYRIDDRPARLERYELRPSPRNSASGALLSVSI